MIAIIFVGLSSLMNVLGGLGTTSAAFFNVNYSSMMALIDFHWLYHAFVIFTLLIGIAGVWVTITLARGRVKAYRNALIVLVLGTLVEDPLLRLTEVARQRGASKYGVLC